MRPTKLLLCVVILIGALISIPSVLGSTTHAMKGELREVKLIPGAAGKEILLVGENLSEFKNFRLSDPARVVLDLKNTVNKFSQSNLTVADDTTIRKIRISQSKNEGVRIVLDLKQNVRDVETVPVDNGLKVRLLPEAGPAPAVVSEVKDIPVDIATTSTPTVEEPGAPIPAATGAEPELTDVNLVRVPETVIKPKAAEPVLKAVAEPLPIMTARVRTAAEPVGFVQDDLAQSVQYTGEPITLDIKEADIVDFFRLISDIEGLNIVVDPSVSGTISMKVENVPWDQVFDLALKNNRLAKVIEGNVVRIGTLTAFKDEEKAREELKRTRDTTTDIVKINYATAADMVDKLMPLMTASGEIKTDARTNSIIIRDIPERINDVRKLVVVLDKPEHQVEIEARIVSANRNFARSIGVQFGFVAGNLERVTVGGPNTFGTIGGTRPSQTPKSAYVAGDPQSGRGASTSEASENASISPGTEGNNKTGNYNISLPAKGATSGIGISVGNILDTFLLDASLTAAEGNGQVRVISQPKVQAQNNRQAVIEQGIQFPVQVVENNTVTVRFFSASLKLTVLPQITDEGTVLMKITIENNRADFVNTVNNIPSIITSMSATEVLVADGGTTVIGGILIDSDQKNNDRVPLLADIPVLGNLFQRNTKSKETQEILFFLTPRIIR